MKLDETIFEVLVAVSELTCPGSIAAVALARERERMNKNLVGLKDECVAWWKERAFTKKQHNQWLR